MRFLSRSLLLLSHTVCLAATTLAQQQLQPTTPHIADELAKVLSPNATIVLPDDPTWNNLTARANSPRISPGYRLVVQVATEKDVAATVRYANHHGIDFLAVSGAHGETTTLNRLRNGIQINLRKLNSVTVHDNDTVTIGGGTLQWELTSQLYSHGRRAVTGLCECVSIIGPLLGGGHSALQSRYGFSADNLVSATVVLGNGTTVVASSTTNPDLFWALRGAGSPPLFTLINEIDSPLQTRDPRFFINGVLSRPSPDADPLFIYSLAYDGASSTLHHLAAPFLALKPTTTTFQTDIPYASLYKVLGFGKETFICQKNTNQLFAGVSLERWDIKGLEKAYAVYEEVTRDPRFTASFILLENYGIVAASRVPLFSTAVPSEERQRPILSTAVIHYNGTDEVTRGDAERYVGMVRDALYEGVGRGERHCYVNYAMGDEGVEEVYGWDKGRVGRLRRLKRRWDSGGRFGCYAPLR